jgi:hypothetical protein
MILRCKWVRDPEVPGGKFLVPGCWNRAIYGDDAECQCVGGTETVAERLEGKIDGLLKRLDKLEARMEGRH